MSRDGASSRSVPTKELVQNPITQVLGRGASFSLAVGTLGFGGAQPDFSGKSVPGLIKTKLVFMKINKKSCHQSYRMRRRIASLSFFPE